MVAAKLIGPIASTEASMPQGTSGATLAGTDYVEEEFLVSGTAVGEPYTTRILVRRPSDPARFSGEVLCEATHMIGGVALWGYTGAYLRRSGHAHVEISSQPSATTVVKVADEVRYADVQVSDDQSPEILTQVGTLLHTDTSILDGAVRHLILTGSSQTGGVTRSFTADHHASARLDDGGPVFGAYFPTSSGGQAVPDIDVPVVEVVGESEMLLAAERSDDFPLPWGPESHRRPDGERFRLYEVAGMPHSPTRAMSRSTPITGIFANCSLPDGAELSQFPMSQVLHALLDNLIGWASGGEAPPSGRMIDLDTDRSIERDRHGNALGGLRTVYMDVPTATAGPLSPGERFCRLRGHQFDFPRDLLVELYGTHDAYVQRVDARLDELIGEGCYLEADADDIRAEARGLEPRFS